MAPGSDACRIRLATVDDLLAINDIYNYYVKNSTCTYQEEPERIEDRRDWFTHRGPMHPVVVAELDNVVVGWGSLSRFHPRSAYRYTVEDSVFVRHDHLRRGIGSALLGDLINRARSHKLRTIVAEIDADQAASILLHERFGFVRCAHLGQVGFKFGNWLDVVYLQLML